VSADTASTELALGSVVRLASGGPRMTVEKFSGTQADERGVHCVWFAGDQQRRDVFPEKALQPAPAEQPSGKRK